ncbi:hypothetical protein [uncultured Roseibium sp.]|uniref:hypothetical protein n=1 Tax=uncultured Roseibium sp. TaxID=1936171 RepID=UPI00261D2624|nr:hypothetical protein [uncultured Roseibium sp.]
MRRPPPTNLAQIRHPGPVNSTRRPFALCSAKRIDLQIPAGEPLLDKLGEWAERENFSSAVLDLSGVKLKSFEYVMPDCAIDDRHVAWYSDTQNCRSATIREGVAILGWRDGRWFTHAHAYWPHNNANHLGHLLPHTLVAEDTSRITGWGLSSASFVAKEDPETEFTLYRTVQNTGAKTDTANALITTLAPFEDLTASIADLAKQLDTETYEVLGLGSLAGAAFIDGKPMTGLISEILLQPGAVGRRDGDVKIPIRCVDLDGGLHSGYVLEGGAPTLVTCELLLVSTS